MSEIINYVDSLVIQHSIKSFLHYQEQEDKRPNLLDIINYVEKDTLHDGLDIIRHVNQLTITLKIKKVKANFNKQSYKLIEKL
tara:strand:- start:1039 stop:1287 length:249 start_codon:yes stop_codon:yes gene_type:complete